MKKQLSLILSLCAIILFSACDETETFDDRWKLDNEAQFLKIASDSEFYRLNSQSGKGFIMYKPIEEGNGSTPLFTDNVKVLYTGWYKNNWSEPDTYTDSRGNLIHNKVVFDSTNRSDIPATFPVNGVVDGFRTALQNMKEGDKWQVWIPWNLGYGEVDNRGIRAYSTLVFELELVEVVKTEQ